MKVSVGSVCGCGYGSGRNDASKAVPIRPINYFYYEYGYYYSSSGYEPNRLVCARSKTTKRRSSQYKIDRIRVILPHIYIRQIAAATPQKLE